MALGVQMHPATHKGCDKTLIAAFAAGHTVPTGEALYYLTGIDLADQSEPDFVLICDALRILDTRNWPDRLTEEQFRVVADFYFRSQR